MIEWHRAALRPFENGVEMKMKILSWRRMAFVSLPALALAAAIPFAYSSTTQAKDAEVVVRVGTVAPEGTPWDEWLQGIKKRVEKESNGRIKYKIFLAGKLGGEKEMVEDAKRGGRSVNLFGGSVGAIAAQYAPELNALELPYIFGSNEEVDFVLNEIRPEVSKALDKAGYVFAMYGQNGWHGYATKKDVCIEKPADLKGLKMRSQERTIHLDTYKAFGASPVEMPVPEVLSALQTGVVDGFSNTPLFAFATSWYSAINTFTYTQHIFQPAVIVYSKDWFKKVPKDLQTILLKADEEKAGLVGVRQLTNPLLDNFTAAGKKVCKLSDAQKKDFVKAAKPVWDKFAKKSKANKAMLDAVLKAKKKFAAR
jgi:TRAP-type C4-dicarboxylate transport system substrate-binding protein